MSYKLIWSDEFDQGTLDTNKWTITTGNHGFGNAESQFYTDQNKNIRIESNQLVIEAHKEDYKDSKYTSGKLTTYKNLSMQYGKIEVRGQIPKGKGSWPAIWMLSDAFEVGEKWPRCGEIDIMEHVGKDEDMIHFSLHSDHYNHIEKTQLTHFERFEKITERFAVYTVIWENDYIEFLIDGISYAKYMKVDWTNDDGVGSWPFDQPYYLILNLAIGGYWGGFIDDDIFPIRFIIDYVRVFKKA